VAINFNDFLKENTTKKKKEEKYKQPEKDTWVRDLSGTNKKVDSYIKSQGGSAADAAAFRRFMDYQSARQEQEKKAREHATNTWKKAHEENSKRQKVNKVNSDRFAARALSEKATPKKSSHLELPKLKNKKKEGVLDNLKGFLMGEKVTDGVSFKDGFKIKFRDKQEGDFDTTLNKIGKVREGEKPTKVDRFIANAANSAALGLPKELAKHTGDERTLNAYYNEREFGKGGGTDMIAQGLGYIAPGVGFVKGVKALGLGAKAGTTGLSKAVQLGKEGAIVGGAMGAAEVGIREGLNPQDQNWKQNLGHVAFGTGTGLVADPVLYGAGRGIAKGVDAGLKKWIPDLPERATTEGFNIPDPKGKQSTLPKKLEPLNLDPAFNAKRYHNPEQPLKEFLGKKPTESELLKIAKKVNYTKRDLPDFSTSRPSIGKPDGDIISTHFGIDVPKDLVDSAPPAYWQKRYEDFVSHVNKNYDSNQLTKEGLDDLWTQFARYDEPVTLEQVVDLAYTGYKEPTNLNAKEVWNQLGNRPAVSQNAKKLLGIDDSMFLKNKGQQIPSEIPEPLPQGIIKKTIFKPESKLELPGLNPNKTETALPKSELQLVAPKNTVNPVNPAKPNESAFFNTVAKQEKTTDEMIQRLNDFDKAYKPMSNQETVDFANRYIANDIEKAFQFVKNARKFDPRHITVGHRLIDEFQAKGDYDRALDVIERLAEQGTKAGQSIQAFSIYGRLSAQGQLLRAQRVVNRINQDIPNVEKHVKLDKVAVNNITHAADSIQRLTGQEDVAKNVMNIMDSIKKGKNATDDELEVVRSFVTDAKKFIGDLTPKPERVKAKITDKRTRDKVVDFMDKKEQLAREELKKIMKRANSLPVDFIYHASVIGASKIAKGSVKFADFTEVMVKDLGEEIRPYMKQIWDKAAETFNLQTEKMTSKRLSEVEKIVNKATKDKTLTQEEADGIQKFLQEYLTLTGDAKLEASMNLQATMQLLERPSFLKKLATSQTIGQLLNPKTIVRNALGNELFYRLDQHIMKLIATPIDIARSKINGTDRVITFRTNNQGQYWKNWFTGGKAGYKGVNPMGLQTMFDLGPQAFRSKYNPMTYLEKSLGATLRSFDHAGYMRAYNQTLGELATLRATNEGLTGKTKLEAIQKYIREADENMMNMADDYGKVATFQDNTALASVLQRIKKWMNFNQEFGFGDLILKYPKTPANLVMRALDYSPAGAIRTAYLIAKATRTKDHLATRDATIALSRAIVGTGGFSIMGYALADLGILTTTGDSDFEVASLEKQAGKQANSVNWSALKRFVASGFNREATKIQEDDTYISYDWAQPIAIAIALGSGVNQGIKENKDPSVMSIAKTSFDSSSNTLLEMSVLSGLKDFLTAYPDKKPSDYFADPIKGMPASFVPTFSNQIRQVTDNSARTTYNPNYFGEMKNKSLNRLPQLEKSLPLSYDTLGKQRQTYQDSSNNFWNVFLNPSFVSKYKPSPEAKFVLDYMNRTGDKTKAPKIPKKELDGIALTGAQHAKMQRIQGETTQAYLKEFIPKLKGADDGMIEEVLDKVLRESTKHAKEVMRKELIMPEQISAARKTYGLSEATIRERIEKGWTISKALTTPNK
jgi:Ca2+-binding EF-hand superfamily protein